MFKSIYKLGLIAAIASSLNAGETQVGHGTFTLESGFVGLTQSIDTDTTTYTISEFHKNIPFQDLGFFYGYGITWYDSDRLVQLQKTVNKYANNLSKNPAKITLPSIDYRLQGLDAHILLGEDLIHKDENNYFGIGLMLGVSIPWIDSKKDSNNNDALSDTAANLMKQSKTKLSTFKVGPSFAAMKSLGNYASMYLSGTYAYQTGSIKNTYAKADFSATGTYKELDIGLKFQPISEDYKLGIITLSPRLYATLGYKYKEWKLRDVSINAMGTGGKFNLMDFKMNTKTAYMGVGYSF